MERLCRALSGLFSLPPRPSQLSAPTGSDVGRLCLEGAVALGPVTPGFAYRTNKSISWRLFHCGLRVVLPAVGKAPDQAPPSLIYECWVLFASSLEHLNN